MAKPSLATLSLAALILGASAAHAQAQAPGPAADASGQLRTFNLDNGLTVVHVERRGLPMVTVQVWYRFGSRHEPAGRRGAARLLERLMFDGSARVRPDHHRQYIERVGGQVTALTTEDVTAYHNAVPVEYLDLALELEAERMRNLFIRPDSVAAAAQQVAEEARRQESSPLYRVYLDLLATAFKGGAYAWPPSGVRGELEGITADEVKALYDAHYVPGNALLVVVGGVDAAAVDAAVKARFGRLEGAAPPAQAPAIGDAAPGRASLAGSPVGLIMAGYRLPPSSHADVPALQVAGAILTGGPSSRLHGALVKKKIAEEIGGQVLVRQGAGLLIVFARFPGDADPAPVEKALLAEVERLATRGPTAAELARARGQVSAAGWFGVESATGMANQIGVSWALGGDPGRFMQELAAVDKVTAAQVKKAAATYLARARASIAAAGPTGARTSGGGK